MKITPRFRAPIQLLQRAQQVQEILHLRRAEGLKIPVHTVGFRPAVPWTVTPRVLFAAIIPGAGMGKNGLAQVRCASIWRKNSRWPVSIALSASIGVTNSLPITLSVQQLG